MSQSVPPPPVGSEPTPPEAPTSEPASRPAPQPEQKRDNPLRASRTSGANAAVIVSIVLIVLLVIFIVQNTESTRIEFLGFEGDAPLSVTLLVAAAVGMAISALVGSLRILQLRRRVKREQKRAKR